MLPQSGNGARASARSRTPPASRVNSHTLAGFAAAGLTVIIWASYPVATRGSLSGSASPQDLVFLRFAVGSLLFLPWLLLRRRGLPAGTWCCGIPLALCQGAGMAALVIFGLQLAPASHAAALGPGASPAWAALLGLLLFSRKPGVRQVLGALMTLAGIMILVFKSGDGLTASVLAGDAMFLAASALGAIYVLQMHESKIDSMLGAAMVAIYSSAVVIPWYFWSSSGTLAHMGMVEIAWQAVWQGVLIGFVSLVAMNHAIARLGAERVCAMFSLVPVLTAILGYLFLAEALSMQDTAGILTISLGIAVATVPMRTLRTAAA